jgi:DNA-binding response OmpR family regulator
MAPRILLVEDEVALLSLAARALRAKEYEVIEAAGGVQAWALAKQSRFDLLITDSKMPHLSGTQLTVLVRELHPSIPVLRICGSHFARPEEPGIRTLFKPFTFEELTKMVSSMLAN